MINKTLLANKYAHKIIGKGFLETQRLLYEFARDIDVTTKTQNNNNHTVNSNEKRICEECGEEEIPIYCCSNRKCVNRNP